MLTGYVNTPLAPRSLLCLLFRNNFSIVPVFVKKCKAISSSSRASHCVPAKGVPLLCKGMWRCVALLGRKNLLHTVKHVPHLAKAKHIQATLQESMCHISCDAQRPTICVGIV